MNNPSRNPIDKRKYLLAFLITAFIFGVGIYVNSTLDQKRLSDIQVIQNQISLDLLSSETQFDLLKASSCKNVGASALSQELNSLANRLSYMEAGAQNNSDELNLLKKNYSLLEIKDFILMQQLNAKCKSQPISVLYFYGDKTNCPECEKMGFVLTYLRSQYPELRIYSFDYRISLSAVDTLKSIYKIDDRALPALVIGDDTFTGFKDIDAIKELIPELKRIDSARAASSTAATSSKATSTSIR